MSPSPKRRHEKKLYVGVFGALIIFVGLLLIESEHARRRAWAERRVPDYPSESIDGLPGYGRQRLPAKCVSALPKFNETYVSSVIGELRVPENKLLRASAYLAHAAMSDTGEGDIAMVGLRSGQQYPRLLLKVVRDLDACGRRLWAFPAAKSKAEIGGDAYRIRTISGPINETCPHSSSKIALLIVSGGSFNDTVAALSCFRKMVLAGGYVMVDDYYTSPEAKRAVDTFRGAMQLWEPLNAVEESSCERQSAAWWQMRI